MNQLHEVHLDEIIEWDICNWSLILKYWENNTSIDLPKAKTIEIGGKNGGLSLWMALKGAKVLCTDLSGPTDLAKLKHKKYGVSHAIDYEEINTLNISYDQEFDMVFFKSILGGIGLNDNKDKQIIAIQQMHKCLKKGGELLFAENLVGSPMHIFMRKNFIRWGDKWRYVTIKEILEMLNTLFSEVKYTTAGFLGTFGRTDFQRKILGTLDQAFIASLVPKDWRYIIFGIAKK